MCPLKHEVGCGRSTHIPIHMHSHHSKGSSTANRAVPSLVPVLPCMNHRLLFLHLLSLSAAPNVPFTFFILCSTQTNTRLARVKSASYRKSNLGVRRYNSCLVPWVSQQRLQNLFLLKNKGDTASECISSHFVLDIMSHSQHRGTLSPFFVL